jgi:hypothetical protein
VERDDIPVVVGDMATATMPGEFSLVYLAELAGMDPERRVADWDGSPFTNDSESHVSVWRKPPES